MRCTIIIAHQRLNHSMCSNAAHHLRRRHITDSADLVSFIRVAPGVRLTTHTHTLSRRTVHAVTEGYGWCTFISRSQVPACCHETDTEAKAKLWVHQGCLPCCLNISLSVYTEPSKSQHRSVNYTESWLLFSYRWIWIKCKVNDPAHVSPRAGRQCLARISLL